MRAYRYVGSAEVRDTPGDGPDRQRIDGPGDVGVWIARTGQRPDARREIVATFIVDTDGALWIADRHSEHVACAAGGPVLSAGETTFRIERATVEVVAVTNQSTGFCPEPESWPAVRRALRRAGLDAPDTFTSAFDFRRCDACGSRNIVKESQFVCGVCDAPLDRNWNFEDNGDHGR